MRRRVGERSSYGPLVLADRISSVGRIRRETVEKCIYVLPFVCKLSVVLYKKTFVMKIASLFLNISLSLSGEGGRETYH